MRNKLLAYLPLNFVVIGYSVEFDSCNLIVTVFDDVTSTATNDGGSGGLACANPNTNLFKVFALRFHTIACLSVSPPAQPNQN